jgi:Helix-loop-helix DNA-binding domain
MMILPRSLLTASCWWTNNLPRMPLDGSPPTKLRALRLEISLPRTKLSTLSYLISAPPPTPCNFFSKSTHCLQPLTQLSRHELGHHLANIISIQQIAQASQRGLLLPVMDTQSFWAPAAAWCRVDTDMVCEGPKQPAELVPSLHQAHDPANPKVKLDSYHQPHYTTNGTWLDMGTSCSEPAPNCLAWYASPTESDGPRTSDLSPVSGYFEWSQSSSNTSPVQYEETICPTGPGPIHPPIRIAGPDMQSPYLNGFPHDRRSSCHETPSISTRQQSLSVAPDFPASDRFRLHPEQGTITVVTNHASPSCTAEPLSESNAGETAENEDSATSRSGKRWKAAHRAVERRYRSNLNLKIIKLGQCIPAIRNQVVGIDDLDKAEDCRATAKSKLQKGHVLSKAVDYIQSLQQHVSELEAEKRQLENRVESLNMIIEEDYQAAADMPQRRPIPEMPRRGSEPHMALGCRSKNERHMVLKTETEPDLLSSKGQYPPSPHQNGFSFVSENPSLSSKRPRVVRSGFSRQSSS